jgi:hypothetical protein
MRELMEMSANEIDKMFEAYEFRDSLVPQFHSRYGTMALLGLT